jgi:hypothetical protein
MTKTFEGYEPEHEVLHQTPHYSVHVNKHNVVGFDIGAQGFLLASVAIDEEDDRNHAVWMASMLDKALSRLEGASGLHNVLEKMAEALREICRIQHDVSIASQNETSTLAIGKAALSAYEPFRERK